MATGTERCDHELLPGQCADCTGRDGGVAAEKARLRALLDQRGVVAAGYAGACKLCGDGFPVGMPVRFSGRVRDWVAGCCLDEHGEVVVHPSGPSAAAADRSIPDSCDASSRGSTTQPKSSSTDRA